MIDTRHVVRALRASAMGLAVAACAPQSTDARYPPRPAGCDVHLFHELAPMPTDNLGPVRARCDPDVSDADCLRTLEDEVCKLGGDVVWQVGDKPELSEGKNTWRGRAGHTKTAPPPPAQSPPGRY